MNEAQFDRLHKRLGDIDTRLWCCALFLFFIAVGVCDK
jgi:hypothetical protein